jgi:pimeloyl-ACP methyl ester carboxylesterase
MQYLTDPQSIANFIAGRLAANMHHYEQMARQVEHPGAIGCWDGERVADLRDNLIVNVYRPRGGSESGLHPVIAFGNTRPSMDELTQFLADVGEDLFPLGVGAYRWAYNGGRLLEMLRDLASASGKRVILTGHSLGGALAQITSCYAAPLVESVITFQSPKTSLGHVGLYRGQNAQDRARLMADTFHYTVRGDLLAELGGQVYTPGAIVELAYRQGAVDTSGASGFLNAHTVAIFPPFARLASPRREGASVARRTIEAVGLEGTQPRPAEDIRSQVVEFLRAHALALHRDAALGLIQDILYALAWDMIAVDILGRRTPDEIRRARTRLRPLRFVLFAWPTDAWPVTPADVLTAAQLDNMRYQLDVLCGQAERGARSPIASPLMVEVSGRAELTDGGVSYLREADPGGAGRRSADTVRAIFNGTRTEGAAGLQSRWLELLIAEDILRYFDARRVGPGTGHAGMYTASTAHGAAIILVGLTLSQVVGHLVDAAVIALADLPGGADDRVDGWSVIRYLAGALRAGTPGDEDLKQSWFNCHQWYLGCEKDDPMHMLSARDIAGRCCDRHREVATFTLDQFRGLAASYRAPGFGEEAEMRPRLHAREWYRFLFRLDGTGQAFVADEHFRIIACALSSQPCALTPGAGIKRVGDKRIDIVQIVPDRHYIEVLDATYRFDQAWHNFKTEFYASFFRSIFANVAGDWRVDGLDYRSSLMRHGTPRRP